jgi:5-formyltetrahydrofolate cyclo-ligase
MTKNEIRLKLKEQRNKLTSKERDSLGTAISNRLFQTDAYINCNMIFPYLSFRSEVDTRDIIRRSVKEGKEVFIPRVEDKDMNFYKVQNLEGLILSKFGISEPPKEEINRYKEPWICDNSYPKLMLLPGLAFDRYGNRIGYGAGYYDRYLSAFSLTHFYKIGLVYDFQVIDRIPANEFDIKADAILTPSGLIYCNQQAD